MGNFQHKKSLGQHFLTSDTVPKWMCDAADLKAGDLVLEIGPGTGILTKEILKRNVKVVALEADERAIDELNKTFPEEIETGQLTVYHVDVRELDLSTITEIDDHNYKVVANIPYYLSGLLFRMFLATSVQPTDLVFLVQKEVAKRAASNLAKGDKESLLSLSVQAYGEASYVKSVGRGHFVPPPNVDSGIIAIRQINRNNFTDLPEEFFFNLLHLGFGQKRKQLLGNLSQEYDRTTLTHIFSTVEIANDVRAEDLPLNIWLKLAKSILKHTQSTSS